LISSPGKKPLAVFTVALDPLKAALVAGSLLGTNAQTVPEFSSEALSVPSFCGDSPLQLLPFLGQDQQYSTPVRDLIWRRSLVLLAKMAALDSAESVDKLWYRKPGTMPSVRQAAG